MVNPEAHSVLHCGANVSPEHGLVERHQPTLTHGSVRSLELMLGDALQLAAVVDTVEER